MATEVPVLPTKPSRFLYVCICMYKRPSQYSSHLLVPHCQPVVIQVHNLLLPFCCYLAELLIEGMTHAAATQKQTLAFARPQDPG